MASESLQCSVVTPEGIVFEGRADSVVIPSHDGEVGILHMRAPLIHKLGAGELRVRRGSDENRWFVERGFCQVIEDRVSVLTQQAVPVSELDAAAAEKELSEALELPAIDSVSARRKSEAVNAARAKLRLARR